MDPQTNKTNLKTTGKRPLSTDNSPTGITTNENSDNIEQINIQDLCATDSWPRFLVMESVDTNNPLSKLSPFVIEKAMKGLCEVVDVKKLRSGALLIEVSRAAQANNLLKQTSFASISVVALIIKLRGGCGRAGTETLTT